MRLQYAKIKYAHGAYGIYSNDQHCLRFCFQVCQAFIYGGGTEKWHSQHQVPYAFKGNNWVGYDNVRSLKAKVHCFAEFIVVMLGVWGRGI